MESGHFQKEKSLNIRLNRRELYGLGKIKRTIYVTDHKSPDSDTVGSSISYAALLRALGYDAIPVLLGNVNRESAFILEVAGLETPKLMENASGHNIVLVDHSEYTQSANELKKANVISIIDHHADGSVMPRKPLIYDARPLGAAATIIWMRYRNYGLEPDKQTAIAMIGAILSDTKNLKSNATTYADREAVKALNKLARIPDIDFFYQKMYKALISYERMSDEEIFFNEYKEEYRIAGKKIAVGCLYAYDEESAKNLIKRMNKTMFSMMTSTGVDMSFTLISILHDDMSVTYFVSSNDESKRHLKLLLEIRKSLKGSPIKLNLTRPEREFLSPLSLRFWRLFSLRLYLHCFRILPHKTLLLIYDEKQRLFTISIMNFRKNNVLKNVYDSCLKIGGKTFPPS